MPSRTNDPANDPANEPASPSAAPTASERPAVRHGDRSVDPHANSGPARGQRFVGLVAVALGALVLILAATATYGANRTATGRAAGSPLGGPAATPADIAQRSSAALGDLAAVVHARLSGVPPGAATPADLAATAQWIVLALVVIGLALVGAGVAVRRRG